MLTIKSAAQLLAAADSVEALTPLAHLLGFTGEPLRLTAGARRDLGIHDVAHRARLIAGPGALRLLVARLRPPLELGPALDARERTRRLAAALVHHAPTRLWCLATLDHDAHTLCLATVADSPHGPRVAALRLDRRRVLDSDADTLRALAAVTEEDALLRHARFTDILRRDALSHRFYRALEQSVHSLGASLAPAPARSGRRGCSVRPDALARRELALVNTSRLLFLAFLEAKGWLDARRDFLMHHTLQALERGGALHDRVLRPLFFGTLNTPRRQRAAAARDFGAVPYLNGGLFTPTPLERRFAGWRFSDDALTTLISGVLDRHRFTAREDSTGWSEAAVDPEMLGRAFESLMAPEERRRSGSFYTPPALVTHAVREALQEAIPGLPRELLDDHATSSEPLPPRAADRLRTQVLALRVLDPACGSGAFLVHTLERLDRLLEAAGDSRPVHDRRRDVLTRSIFGVDREPLAVWLCELRLWLSVVIDSGEDDIARIAPLPNLDHHIRVGDSLTGGTFEFAPPSSTRLRTLRTRYTRASGARKIVLATQLDREERQRAVAELERRVSAVQHERAALIRMLRARDLFGARPRPNAADRARLDALRLHARDLRQQRRRLALGAALPFRFAAMFADVATERGFSLVVGNPPWVRPHALHASARVWLRQEFRSMRHATWRDGASAAGAGAGFGAQPDLAAAFIERSMQLLAPGGTLALLVPAKLWRTLSGGGIRRVLLDTGEIRSLHDWSDAPAQFDAATYPSLLVAARPRTASTVRLPLPTTPLLTAPAGPLTTTTGTAAPIHVAITRTHTTRFTTTVDRLPLGGDAGAPWVLLPPPVHAAFETLRRTGVPLAQSPVGRPLLGVKCGCNAAFLVRAVEHDDDTASVTATTSSGEPPRHGIIERTLLRPALRGEDLLEAGETRTSGAATPPLRIVWTHDPLGHALRTLPPATARWLAHWRPRLRARTDARQRHAWWSLFRIDAARYDVARVVWADIGRRLRLRVLLPGDPTVPLNSCYVVRTPHPDDAFALCALMHSTIAAAWLDVLAEPARGGFRRFLGWTVAALPVPTEWRNAVIRLAPFGRAIACDRYSPGIEFRHELDEVVAGSYGIPIAELLPLLDWYRS